MTREMEEAHGAGYWGRRGGPHPSLGGLPSRNLSNPHHSGVFMEVSYRSMIDYIIGHWRLTRSPAPRPSP